VVASLVFSPDGMTLASASELYKLDAKGQTSMEAEAGTINLWPLE
jgi:hypothetical protein